MAAACEDTLFENAVKRILKSWTVLELAVSHGFGGAHSQEKGDWMVLAVCQWFKENDNIEPYELEDFLADVLNTEFDTIAEDGSIIQISDMICKMYRLCTSGQKDEVMDRLKHLPSPQLQQCVSAPASQEECPGDEDDGDVVCNGESEEANTQQNTSLGSHQVREESKVPEEDMETDEQNAADGWTVVKKGKRR